MKIKILIIGILLILVLSNIAVSVKTNNINDEYSFDGYILFTPWLGRVTYLIDNESEIVNKWQSRYIRGLPVYLLENGNLLRADTAGFGLPLKFFFAGGCTGRIEMFDWEGNKIWNYLYVNKEHCIHNDIELLPNGNILMLVWDLKTHSEAIGAGMDPKSLGLISPIMVDRIIEVEPTYPIGGNIVWQWSVWDHLIQDFDSTKDNYGGVADHPELIDVNSKGRSIVNFRNIPFVLSRSDFSHFDSIDYNEELDQILVGSRYLNEIFIIDHNTTIQEARGHTGGTSGKGGDILYRWGNPLNYHAGNSSDQQLYAQHDARWIEDGSSGEGNILIFDNGFGRLGDDYSIVLEIVLPAIDKDRNYYLENDSAYGPEEPVWMYTSEEKTDFYSDMMSGAQRLPDGNTLICSGTQSKFFIVTPEKEIVWEYSNKYPIPFFGLNYVFNTQYYPKDYTGLEKLENK